eukprot:366406-Chlamydomonas_euryale.AAC.1
MSSNLEGSGDTPRVPHFCARSAIVRISGCRRSLTQKTSRKLIKISPTISPTGDISPQKKNTDHTHTLYSNMQHSTMLLCHMHVQRGMAMHVQHDVAMGDRLHGEKGGVPLVEECPCACKKRHAPRHELNTLTTFCREDPGVRAAEATAGHVTS